MRLRVAASLSLLSLIVACGGPKDGDGGDASDGGSQSATDASASASGSGSESEGESSTTGEPFEPYTARGLRITRVEANPGVAVPIGLDGEAVEGAGRNAYLPPRRDTLIRAYVAVDDDWVTRSIEARLTLTQQDGTETTLTDTFEIDGDTFPGKLTSGINFGVPAELMLPGVQYRMTLWETAWGYEDQPEADPPAAAPYVGSAFIGVEDTYLNLRVVVVPVDYKFGTCQAVVDGEAIRKSFEDNLFQQNALESIELEIHAPHKVTYDMTSMNGLNKLVNEMSQMRAADGVDPNVYYYGIFDSCGACIGGGGGISTGCTVGLAADITGASKSDAYGRAAAGQMKAEPAATFTHEIGHTQGRRHIACPGGNSAGNDPSYPYANGEIHVWGFGVRDFALRHPTASYDYMSYCGNTWCSDWEWNATFQRIQILSGWEMEGEAEPEGPGLLIGAIAPDGSEEWWTSPGSLGDAERSATTASPSTSAAR
ncbi:MAG: hypothetical protein R3B09_31880 [Nannocystaceae bacterium]